MSKLTDEQTSAIAAVINDTGLTWKSKGIAATIISNEDTFADHTIKSKLELLGSYALGGLSVIRSALQELESAGYLSRELLKNKNGGPQYTLGSVWKIKV